MGGVVLVREYRTERAVGYRRPSRYSVKALIRPNHASSSLERIRIPYERYSFQLIAKAKCLLADGHSVIDGTGRTDLRLRPHSHTYVKGQFLVLRTYSLVGT